MSRYAPVMVPAAAPGFVVPGLFTAGRIEVVGGGAIGSTLVAKLREAGVDAHATQQVSEGAAGVVFASGLTAAEGLASATALHVEALAAARVLSARGGNGERVFVTLQSTGGDFGLSGRAGERAWTAGLAGLTKTVAAEWADAAVKAIDVGHGAPAVVAERVASELLSGGREVEVGFNGAGARQVVRHVRAPYRQASRARVRKGSVLLVSGGARGVTAASLLSLCKFHPRLALFGRTTLVPEGQDTLAAGTDAEVRRALLARAQKAGVAVLPKELARQAKIIADCREILANLAMLEGAGAEVRYVEVDVRSEASVREAVDAVRAAWGPIHGIVHGAGVLADANINVQTDEQFDRVFGTKVDGLHHLLAATQNDPLEVLLAFASVAGRFGNPAQASYAMANEVLSAVVAGERARRGPRCQARALAWGPWAGGMVTPGLAKLFEKAGVQLLALDAGADALAREVASEDDPSQLILMNGEPALKALPLHGGRVASSEERFDLLVSASSVPYLDGHRIKGVAVVPAVLVLEWFQRAARAAFPALAVSLVRELRVLRGVPVEAFDGAGARLVLRTKAIAPAVGATTTLEVKLDDDQGKPRYAALVDLVDEGAARAKPLAAPAPRVLEGGKPWPWSLDHAYREVLFHTGPFKAIRGLDLASEAGATGQLVGLEALGWPAGEGGWESDVALMDGGVQLGAAWAHTLFGRLPLPTRIGAYEPARGRVGAVSGPVRAFVRGRRAGAYRVVVDVTFVDDRAPHAPIATLSDVELTLPPTPASNAPSTPPATPAPAEPGAA